MCFCLPTAIEVDTIDTTAHGRTTIHRKTYGIRSGSSSISSGESWEEKPRIRFGTTKIWPEYEEHFRNPQRLLDYRKAKPITTYHEPRTTSRSSRLAIEPGPRMAGGFDDIETVEVVDASPDDHIAYASPESDFGVGSAQVRYASPTRSSFAPAPAPAPARGNLRSRMPAGVAQKKVKVAPPKKTEGAFAARRAMFEQNAAQETPGVRYGSGPTPTGRRR